jgi:GNAT superfamily N-acetyltransferase
MVTLVPEADMPSLTTRELSTQTWDDLEQVLGERGGSRGCWCMHWRLSFAEWEKGRGDGNRDALRERAGRGPAPGLVGYLDGEPVAWIAVGDRGEYPRMARSPAMRPVDDTPGWVVSCVFVRSDHRGSRLPVEMIRAACELAARSGQRTVEAVPVDPVDGRRAGPDNAMTGIASAYRDAGFVEVARPKPDRPVMRWTVSEDTRSS